MQIKMLQIAVHMSGPLKLSKFFERGQLWSSFMRMQNVVHRWYCCLAKSTVMQYIFQRKFYFVQFYAIFYPFSMRTQSNTDLNHVLLFWQFDFVVGSYRMQNIFTPFWSPFKIREPLSDFYQMIENSKFISRILSKIFGFKFASLWRNGNFYRSVLGKKVHIQSGMVPYKDIYFH